MDRIVVNVEAQTAKRKWDEAETTWNLAADLRQQAADLIGDVENLEIEVQKHPEAARLLAASEKLFRDAQGMRLTARNMVARALSLETGTDPAELEPIVRVPIPRKEIKAREKAALEDHWEDLRARRDALLASSDWTAAPDSPLSATMQTKWKRYRQALRDLPGKTDDPVSVNWPTPPGEKP